MSEPTAPLRHPDIAAVVGLDCSEWERLLAIAAVVADHLKPTGIHVRVVGGLAVSTWTRRMPDATDIDIIAPTTQEMEAVMADLGFTREGRHWFLPGTTVALEAPASFPEPGFTSVRVTPPGGRSVFVESPESITINRLDEFVGTGSSTAFRQIVDLLSLPLMDYDSLNETACLRGLEEELQVIRTEATAALERGRFPETWELHELARDLRRRRFGPETSLGL